MHVASDEADKNCRWRF